VNKTLLNTHIYRAYVKVIDTAGSDSGWRYHQFTMNIVPLATPNMTLTPDAANRRVLISVTTGAVPGTALVALQYSDGGEWDWVRGATALVPVAGAVSAYDYEIPFDTDRDYRALTYTPDPWNTSDYDQDSTTIAEDRRWVLSVPERSDVDPITIRISDEFDVERETVAAVFRPVGRKNAIVVTDGAPKSGEFSLTTQTLDQPSRAEFEEICELGVPLLLRDPFGRARYIVLMQQSTKLVKATKVPGETTFLRDFHEWNNNFVEIGRPNAAPDNEDLKGDVDDEDDLV
jgi:hypothetical protein